MARRVETPIKAFSHMEDATSLFRLSDDFHPSLRRDSTLKERAAFWEGSRGGAALSQTCYDSEEEAVICCLTDGFQGLFCP